LTEAEWIQAVEFLTLTGQTCSDTRQEFILLSDVLGLSMLMVAMAHHKPTGCTDATVLGPFYVPDAPHCDNGADVANGASGQPCVVHGMVRGLGGS
jgi:hydroxyquinol 1,2-dioxygenase